MMVLLVWFLSLFTLSPANAADFSLTLQWDENTEPDLATGSNPRYKIYYKTTTSGADVKANYIGLPSSEPAVANEGPSPVICLVSNDENPDPNIVQRTLHGLDTAFLYWIAVTALDNYGNESDLSCEVCSDPAVCPDGCGGGNPDPPPVLDPTNKPKGLKMSLIPLNLKVVRTIYYDGIYADASDIKNLPPSIIKTNSSIPAPKLRLEAVVTKKDSLGNVLKVEPVKLKASHVLPNN